MRFIHIALFAAVLAVSISYAAPELLLQAAPSETVLEGWNCAPSGGPAQYYAKIYVENPYSSTMQVSHSYYDYQQGGFVEGGRFCTVPAMSGQHCFLTIPVMLGGEPSGEAALPVQLSASVEGMSGTMGKEIIFTIRHVPPSTETSVLEMIGTTQDRLANSFPSLESICASGDVCCGMKEFREKFDSAGSSLATARGLVSQCRFTDAVASASNASASVNEVLSAYNSTLKSCKRALQAYSDAYGNFSSANLTIVRRASCGIDVSDSRAELSTANSMLSQAEDLIQSDAYADALLYAAQAQMSLNTSLSLSTDSCPHAGFRPSEPATASTPSTVATQEPPPEGGDMLSGAFSALGYLVIAAIIIVVGAAIYVSLGKRHIDSFISRGPRIMEGFGKPPPSPPAGGEELPPMDHTKVEEEFQDWLKTSGLGEKAEKRKSGRAK